MPRVTEADLHAAEAGRAASMGRGLVEALYAGDAAKVARLVRSLVATATACDERADAIVAAPGGAR